MDPWTMMGPPMSTGYPTMPNQYGIGQSTDASGQGGFGAAPTPGGPAGPSDASPGMAGAPGYLAQPLNNAAPDTSSRGFNPWSLTGEANARGN